MASIKFVVFTAVTLLLNCHWAKTQYIPGYNQVYYEDDDNDLDDILPFVILALLGRGRYGGCGGFGGFGGCGGCGIYGGGGGCGSCGGFGSSAGGIHLQAAKTISKFTDGEKFRIEEHCDSNTSKV
uniref:Uncharacterized protein n=1 Tax=Bombyx mori TaxID=7091 RepID=A0A8R2M3Q7_BOMMO|nr:uncharacterized protein LOC101739437 isoform X2 [Bombyx mori]